MDNERINDESIVDSELNNELIAEEPDGDLLSDILAEAEEDDFKLDDKALNEIESISDYNEEEALEDAKERENEIAAGQSRFMQVVRSDGFLNNAIRILLGLVCIVVSKIGFVPPTVSMILAAAAILLCGYPVFLNALDDVKQKKLLSENVFASLAAVFSFFVGYPADGTIMMLIADLGFKYRDFVFDRIKADVDEKLGDREIKQKGSVLSRPVKSVTDVYSFAVLLVAVIVAIISAIVGGDGRNDWLHRALIVMLAAVPCAVVFITSLTYKSGMVGALEKGIAFNSTDSISSAARLTSVIFNKTGTITEGNYKISGVFPVRLSESQLLYLAAYAEAYSDHPLAEAVREYSGVTADKARIAQHREESGIGCIVQLDSSEIISAGSLELMERLGVRGDMVPGDGTSIYVAVRSTYVGRIDLIDNIKIGAGDAVASLKSEGVANIALMTGGDSNSATKIGRQVGISEIYADYLPKDKYDRVRYIHDSQERDDKLAFVAGANNSSIPAMKLADVGIILGGNIDAPASDIAAASDDPGVVSEIIAIAKKVYGKVTLNTVLLYAVKAVSIILGLCGFFTLFGVVLLDLAAFFAAALNGYSAKNIK